MISGVPVSFTTWSQTDCGREGDRETSQHPGLMALGGHRAPHNKQGRQPHARHAVSPIQPGWREACLHPRALSREPLRRRDGRVVTHALVCAMHVVLGHGLRGGSVMLTGTNPRRSGFYFKCIGIGERDSFEDESCLESGRGRAFDQSVNISRVPL